MAPIIRTEKLRKVYAVGKERVVALNNVDLSIEKGEFCCIVGQSGSGKSTLVSLIPRLYDASTGSVSVMGSDVRAWPLDQLRHVVATVPQRASLVSGTIRSNLTWRDESATDEELWAALDMAQASEFVRNKLQGLDAPVEAGGKNFSGGQRQRLAIARALAKKPEVVVFDDSFSALDYKTDARLREELAKNVTDAALVVVAQRIATIMHADQIIVLDDGHVVGTGTHEELLRSCPAYLEIAQSQLSAEELGLTQEEIAAVTEGGER